MHYDRRAPKELLGALGPAGFAHSLVEYGRSGAYALDLQLRGYEGKNNHWATLYVGLTKVLDLDYLPSKGFRLRAHPTHATAANGWRGSWSVRRPADWWSSEWAAVEEYLEAVIVKVGSSHLKEGAVQSAISGFESSDRFVIDRECVVSFDSLEEKKRISNRLATELLGRLERTAAPTWWRTRPSKLGGECDALAIDSEGRLVAIEIKPADASTLPWALVQVLHYKRLFELWGRTNRLAPDVLAGMIEQRRRLGLGHLGGEFKVSTPITVVPALAFDRRAGKTARTRLAEVFEHLHEAGVQDEVQLFQVNRIGRLDPLGVDDLR